MTSLHRVFCLLALLMLLAMGPMLLRAQEPAVVRKSVLPSLDSQVAARLIALDRRLNPVHAPQLAVSVVTQLAASASPLGVFAPIVADPRNQEIWEQLPEEYYRMSQESGDALATVPPVSPHLGVGWSSGQVRRLCHQRLAALPRASLELYRQRVDAEAKALLEQGRQTRSPVPLRRLVDELFCSSVGDAALELLGDLAFQKGEFDEARHWWSLLAPLDEGRADRLLFPHPKVDLIRIQARQILAMIFHGRLDEAQAEIARFSAAHPQATGALAGQDDVFGVILRKTLQTFARERMRSNDEPWTTFGGDAARNRTLSQGVSWQLWEDGPAWRVALPALHAEGKPPLPDRAHPSRRAAYHPVIVNNQVLIADHRSVVSYDLFSGKELFRYQPKMVGLNDLPPIDAKVPLPRFTLSADHERAYVRLGRLEIEPGKDAASYLICLDLTQPGVNKNRELWQVRARGEDKAPAFFEGAPLVHDGRLYVAVSKVVGRRVLASIECYDVLGRRRWTREVCDCPEFEEHADAPRQRQHLLTLAGGLIVYCSNAGAIVAVDAWTGQPAWAMRYPSRGPLTSEHEPSPRDLAPCLAADGRLFAAPLDSDRVFCLDAVTGLVRWELEGIEVVHLLGVVHGRLFAATRTGMTAIEASTGQTDWSQPSEGRLPSLGRGLLAGGWLIWPTQDSKLPYRAVTLRSGRQQKDREPQSVLPEVEIFDPTMLHTLPAGNLAFGQGCLAITGVSELVVYVPAHKLKDLPPPDARPQTRIDTQYQQARRLASVGQTAEASQAFRQLITATKGQRHEADWRTLIDIRLKSLDPMRRKHEPHGAPVAIAKAPPAMKHPPVPDGPALPLVQAWSHEGGRLWPSDEDEHRDDFFFSTQAGQLSCRGLEDGALHGQARLDFEPTWFGRWGDLVLISGPDGAQALRVRGGARAWSFAAPSRQWRLGSVHKCVPTVVSAAAGIVYAERWGETLLVLDDHRHFYRLRLDTGEVAWQHVPPAAALRPLGAAAFEPHVARVDDQLWVQSITGQPYRLNAKHSATRVGTASRPWLQPPVVTDKCVIIAAEEGRVIAHAKMPPHEPLWTYQAPWLTSLTGDLCRLYRKDSVLLVLVPRNEGFDCVRLDAARGTVLWAIAARQLPYDVDAQSLCIGELSFYYVHAGKLHARSLNDGSLQWSQSLPTVAPRWQIRYTKDYLAVYPALPASKDDSGEFGVALIDPWDGGLLQRLTFPGERGPGQVLLTPRQVLVSVGGRICGFRSLDAE